VTTTPNGSVEAATSYLLEWSTLNTFPVNSTSSYTFKANGAGGTNVWILNNLTSGVTGNPFSNGTAYFFRVQAQNTAGHPAGWTYFESGNPGNAVIANATAVTIGAPTAGNAVSGAVTIPAGVPIGANAALYVGFYDTNTNNIYATRIGSPVTGANSYSVNVPTGSSYFNFAILDNNNDGLVDSGDDTNTQGNSKSGVAISGATTGQDINNLPSTNSTATVGTQYSSTSSTFGSSTHYVLNLNLRGSIKLPVSVTLTSGIHVIDPVDLSACSDCGQTQFQYSANVNTDTPFLTDTYSFLVTYSDGSSETVTGGVTAWNNGSTVVGAADLPSSLLPAVSSSTSLTPTFTWSDPLADSTDTFGFSINQQSGCSSSCLNWQIPGNNSNSNGFSNSVTSLTWGIDPTDSSNNLPGGTTLTSGQTYNWQITAQDSNGNQALTQVYYIP
jgi:hypothetical protein